MCGIVGLVSIDRSADDAQELVAAMAERIAHRGPDGGGVVAHRDATIGMKRLAIVDIAHGQQPMANDDGSIVLVQNGEIYNAPELRRSLERDGVRFKTRSDTEVILRLYERDPDHVEESLVGMWAFAIHDRRRRRVLLSRDRFGIKPLFVIDTGRTLAFASELRAFDRSLPEIASCFAIDHAAAHAMVSWSYVPENATIFRGVRRLAPASRLEIDLASGKRTTRSYWTVRGVDVSNIHSLDDAADAVEAVLRRSVRAHLESDVPVASFLSGGIDSSLITALAHEESGNKVQAFSIGFSEPRFDESPFARQTARMIGVETSVEILDEATARSQAAEVFLAYDEPFGDSSSLATFLLAQHVARTHKVALGGDGGDEVFAGYSKYLIVKARKPFEDVPWLRDELGRWLSKVPARSDRTHWWTELSRVIRRLARGLAGSASDAYAELGQVAPLARTAALMRQPAGFEFIEHARGRYRSHAGSDLRRFLASDLGSPLSNDMLVKVDRATMHHGLEARVPFLDHRVVELGISLPDKFLHRKRVLRHLHERRFGRALARRRKQGFGVPVERWLRGAFEPACLELFEKSRLDQFEILRSDQLSGGRHRKWLASDPLIVWHAFSLAAWCEAVLGNNPNHLRDILANRRRA